jgi:hypothetical protein
MVSNSIAIIVAGALIALSIALTNHWEMVSSGEGTYRLNRWTGGIHLCLPQQTGESMEYACSSSSMEDAKPAASAFPDNLVSINPSRR